MGLLKKCILNKPTEHFGAVKQCVKGSILKDLFGKIVLGALI